jgi:hypothetical protein
MTTPFEAACEAFNHSVLNDGGYVLARTEIAMKKAIRAFAETKPTEKMIGEEEHKKFILAGIPTV